MSETTSKSEAGKLDRYSVPYTQGGAQVWDKTEGKYISFSAYNGHAEIIRDALNAADSSREGVEELEAGYGRLMIAALDAIPNLSGGEVKTNLRDAYDEATNLLAKHTGEGK